MGTLAGIERKPASRTSDIRASMPAVVSRATFGPASRLRSTVPSRYTVRLSARDRPMSPPPLLASRSTYGSSMVGARSASDTGAVVPVGVGVGSGDGAGVDVDGSPVAMALGDGVGRGAFSLGPDAAGVAHAAAMVASRITTIGRLIAVLTPPV